MTDLLTPCDALEPPIRAICRGEDPNMKLCDVNHNRAHGFAGRIAPLLPLTELPESNPHSEIHFADIPPVMIRGWNFAKAIVKWTMAGMPRRTQQEIDDRLKICQACPHLQNQHCAKCGCACNERNQLLNKLAISTERCPLEKWS